MHKRIISFLLTLAIIVGYLPSNSNAINNQQISTTLGSSYSEESNKKIYKINLKENTQGLQRALSVGDPITDYAAEVIWDVNPSIPFPSGAVAMLVDDAGLVMAEVALEANKVIKFQESPDYAGNQANIDPSQLWFELSPESEFYYDLRISYRLVPEVDELTKVFTITFEDTQSSIYQINWNDASLANRPTDKKISWTAPNGDLAQLPLLNTADNTQYFSANNMIYDAPYFIDGQDREVLDNGQSTLGIDTDSGDREAFYLTDEFGADRSSTAKVEINGSRSGLLAGLNNKYYFYNIEGGHQETKVVNLHEIINIDFDLTSADGINGTTTENIQEKLAYNDTKSGENTVLSSDNPDKTKNLVAPSLVAPTNYKHIGWKLDGVVYSTNLSDYNKSFTSDVTFTAVYEKTIIEETTTQEIPFETEYQADPSLAFGEQKVEVEGLVGEKTITTQDGVVISEETTKQPVTKIVKVGNVEKTTSEIAFTSERVADPEMLEGQEVVTQAGKNGVSTTIKTYEVDPNTGQVSNPTATTAVTTQPVKEIVTYGTKKTVAPVITTQDIPFETEYQADPSLAFGEEKVEVEGLVGEKTITTQDGVIVSEETTKQPVTKIVKIGNINKEEKTIDFGTERIYVKSRLATEGDVLVREGQKGNDTITTTYKVDSQTGELVGPNTVTVRTKEVVNAVYEYGDAVVATPIVDNATTTRTEEIAFEVKYQADPSLAFGEEKVAVEGLVGERTIVKEGEKEISNEVTKQPVTKIVKVGNVDKAEKVINFGTERVYVKSRLATEGDVLVKEGQNGIDTTTITYQVDPKTGQLVGANSETVRTKEVVNAVYEYGDAVVAIPIVDNAITKTTEEIPFEIKYQVDPNLAFGEQNVEDEGIVGEKIVTKQNGEIISEEITKQPVSKIVKIGNIVKTEVNVPAITETIENPEMYAFETPIEKQGKDGKNIITITYKVDEESGKLIEEKTEVEISVEPVNIVIEKGTKVADKTKLNDLIIEADKQELDDKTSDSVELFKIALEKANQVFNNPNVKQEEVDKAWKDLFDAIENLKTKDNPNALVDNKDTDDKDEPKVPVDNKDTDDKGGSNGSVDNKNTDENNSPVDNKDTKQVVNKTTKPVVKDNKTKNPNTGDYGIVPTMMLLAFAFVGLTLLRKRVK